jgi:hypothetical protein
MWFFAKLLYHDYTIVYDQKISCLVVTIIFEDYIFIHIGF